MGITGIFSHLLVSEWTIPNLANHFINVDGVGL